MWNSFQLSIFSNSCSGKQGICKIYHMMAEMKQNHILRDYREDNLLAIFFQPVKAIAVDNRKDEEAQKEDLLTELFIMIQNAFMM